MSPKPEDERYSFGSGKFEFGRWETPFENALVDILGLNYVTGIPARHGRVEFLQTSSKELSIRGHSCDDDNLFCITFASPSAFRVLDEGGLMEFWMMTTELGGRPGQTTFKVRNHQWTHESPIPFIHGSSEGWSYVIATDWDCVEIIAPTEPTIERLKT